MTFISEAVVVVKEEDGKQRQLIAYIAVESQLDAAGLTENLAMELPDFMIPAHIVQLDKLPLTPNGKINREALPQPGAQPVRDDYIPPADDIQWALVEIWSGILGIASEEISRDAHFFQLGGPFVKSHSTGFADT